MIFGFNTMPARIQAFYLRKRCYLPPPSLDPPTAYEPTNLRAYRADPTLKARYLFRIRTAQAVVDPPHPDKIDPCPVESYPVDLGIPLPLAYFKNHIFGSLSSAEGATWSCRFHKAIPVGADLSNIVWQWFDWLFKEANLLRTGPDNEIERAIRNLTLVLAGLIENRRIDRKTVRHFHSHATQTELAASKRHDKQKTAETLVSYLAAQCVEEAWCYALPALTSNERIEDPSDAPSIVEMQNIRTLYGFFAFGRAVEIVTSRATSTSDDSRSPPSQPPSRESAWSLIANQLLELLQGA